MVHPLHKNSNTAVLLLFVIVLHTAIYSAIIFVAWCIRTLHSICWIKKRYLVRNQFYAVASSSHMSNNKPNSTAHSIAQGISSSLLIVIHQYTEFIYIHTLFRGSLIQKALRCLPWSFSIDARSSACTFHTTYYEFNIVSFCHLSSNQCSSSQIIHACHMKYACQTIQLSRGACAKKNIIPQRDFHVMCVFQKYSPTISDLIAVFAGHHSSGGKCDRTKQSLIELELRPILFQPHELSIQVMIFRLTWPLCTGHGCAAVCNHLEPTSQGWYLHGVIVLSVYMVSSKLFYCTWSGVNIAV